MDRATAASSALLERLGECERERDRLALACDRNARESTTRMEALEQAGVVAARAEARHEEETAGWRRLLEEEQRRTREADGVRRALEGRVREGEVVLDQMKGTWERERDTLTRCNGKLKKRLNEALGHLERALAETQATEKGQERMRRKAERLDKNTAVLKEQLRAWKRQAGLQVGALSGR